MASHRRRKLRGLLVKYGIFSGMTWAIDTLILGIALSLTPFIDSPEALALAAITSAFLHDFFAAMWMWIYMALRRRLSDTRQALRNRGGKAIILGAMLGGPIGMSGYLIAINNIGPAYTAIISTFYPAFGAILAFALLKERMTGKQLTAFLVALAAVVYMGYLSTSGDVVGNGMLGLFGAILTVVAWGSEAVIGAWGMRHAEVDNETALHIRETTSALVYGIVMVPIFGSWSFTLDSVFTLGSGVVLLAAFAGTVSYLFYYKAIATIGAARGMAANISYSAWAVVFSLIFLQQVPNLATIICTVLIMAGTVLAASDWNELFSSRKGRRISA